MRDLEIDGRRQLVFTEDKDVVHESVQKDPKIHFNASSTAVVNRPGG